MPQTGIPFTHLKMNLPELYPLRFEPYLKKIGWGGNRIALMKGIVSNGYIGESWEISGLEGFETKVSEGPLSGETVTGLIEKYGEDFVGKNSLTYFGTRFPLLVKFIDARDNLSVQVHPDEETAEALGHGHGKHEICYIMEASDGARIYSGLKGTIGPETLLAAARQGTIMDFIVSHPSKPGDVYPVPAGRIHAFGAGNFIAEVQLSSDVTYRIYDYNRPDTSGCLRQLHLEEARQAIDFKVYDSYKEDYDRNRKEVSFAGCRWFVVTLVKVDGDRSPLPGHQGSFIILMGVDGNAGIDYPGGSMILQKGESVLIPASMSDVYVRGNGKILTSHIPENLP